MIDCLKISPYNKEEVENFFGKSGSQLSLSSQGVSFSKGKVVEANRRDSMSLLTGTLGRRNGKEELICSLRTYSQKVKLKSKNSEWGLPAPRKGKMT